MLRLIGLVVVVLLVLSLAHGERTGGAAEWANGRADTLADALTGRLADGVRRLGDLVFGPSGLEVPDLREITHALDTAGRSADATSRRALAAAVLRACPSLGLACQPVSDVPSPRRPAPGDPHGRAPEP